jgi:hypothetical protein
MEKALALGISSSDCSDGDAHTFAFENRLAAN